MNKLKAWSVVLVFLADVLAFMSFGNGISGALSDTPRPNSDNSEASIMLVFNVILVCLALYLINKVYKNSPVSEKPVLFVSNLRALLSPAILICVFYLFVIFSFVTQNISYCDTPFSCFLAIFKVM